ncbi:MAG: hypothetical protein QOH27_527 [Mycobacterium sp.]|jgi:hypothetical protein|nr:hypothetical protein [Mycobacterium sp.]
MAKAASSPNGAKSGSHATSSGDDRADQAETQRS